MIFLLDLFVSRRAWCGHLCPVGAFYSLLGFVSPLRVSAANRAKCDDCMDCFRVCPEQQVIKPASRRGQGLGPVILSGNCTNCGRCIDVCARDVFQFDIRSHNTSTPGHQKTRGPAMKHETVFGIALTLGSLALASSGWAAVPLLSERGDMPVADEFEQAPQLHQYQKDGLPIERNYLFSRR